MINHHIVQNEDPELILYIIKTNEPDTVVSYLLLIAEHNITEFMKNPDLLLFLFDNITDIHI